jgi:AcrR family transcriptional regulator
MNKSITSQEAILCVGKKIVLEKGMQGLNIRDVARRCGVSVGSIYNYFPTKSDLMVATIESVWKEIMHGYKKCEEQHSFVDSVQSLFLTIQKSSEKYPSFFSAHSMSLATLDKEKGRQSMERHFTHMKQGLLAALYADGEVNENTFSPTFHKEGFIEFVFTNLITLLIQETDSCDFLLEAIRRIIYK